VTRIATAAAVLLIAGCSTQQWDKPGATAHGVEADARACAALAESYPAAPARRNPQRSVTDLDADRQLVEAQRREACMKQKGYSLRPG
jgi:hypothetical protein